MPKFKRDYKEGRLGDTCCNVSDVIQRELDYTKTDAAFERLTDMVKVLAELLPEKLQEEFVIQLNADWHPDPWA